MRQHINLVAKGLLFQESVIPWKTIALPLVLILCLGVIAGRYLLDLRSARALEKETQRLTLQKQRLQQEMVTATKEIQVMAPAAATAAPSVDQQLKAVNDLLRSRVLWSDVLREVSLLAPEGVYLTHLATTEAKATGLFTGKPGKAIRFAGFAQSHGLVTSFMAALERSTYFTDVNLIYAQKGSEGGTQQVEFELVGHLKAGES